MEMLTTKRDPGFTPRTFEIFELIAHPYSRKQIREMLDMNKKTLESHITRIMDKTGIHDYVELIAFAQEYLSGVKQSPRITEGLNPSMVNTTQKTEVGHTVAEF